MLLGDIAVGFEPDIEVADREKHWHQLCELYLKNGYSYIDIFVSMDLTSLEATIRYLAKIRGYIRNTPHCLLACSSEDILLAKEQKKLAILFSFQGTNPLASDFDMLDVYHALGVRRMIISYNVRNSMGDGCTETDNGGLSLLGKKLISAMNERGIIPDCSHVGEKTSFEVMEQSTKPVVFSHSNPKALFPHARSITDAQIDACAKTKGLVGINGISILLGGEPSPDRFAEAIDYVAQRVGVEHVAIGSDYLIFPSDSYVAFHKAQALFYSGIYLKKMEKEEDWRSISPKQIDQITEILIKKGYSQKQLAAIFGENYLRVLRLT